VQIKQKLFWLNQERRCKVGFQKTDKHKVFKVLIFNIFDLSWIEGFCRFQLFSAEQNNAIQGFSHFTQINSLSRKSLIIDFDLRPEMLSFAP